jgi:hypothetical protein
LKILKCGTVEEWRRSVGPIVLKMKKHKKGKGGEEEPTNNKKKEG